MLGGIFLIARPWCAVPAAVVTFVLFKASNGDEAVAIGGNFWEGYFTMFAIVFPIVAIVWTLGIAFRKKLNGL